MDKEPQAACGTNNSLINAHTTTSSAPYSRFTSPANPGEYSSKKHYQKLSRYRKIPKIPPALFHQDPSFFNRDWINALADSF